jgi:hypothetical protein
MKALQNCQWDPRWVAHLGCVKGCLNFLGIEVSDAWLYGGTGHAFAINLHEEVCPSGPTAWDTSKLFELGTNLGYKVDGVFGLKDQEGFPERQQCAWEHARQAIDQGLPCYGWELEIPEYYVVYGYDDVGYYYSGPGCDGGKGPKPWQELGDTGIGVLEMYSVRAGEAADDATTVREALAFALEHATSPTKWIHERYKAGPEGFDSWIRALEDGRASDMGMRYNTGVWLECRRNAVGFLEEARARLAGRADALFDEARARYVTVSEALNRVSEIYPWSSDASGEAVLPTDDRSRAAAEALRAAREAEVAGLQALDAIVRTL